MDITPKLREALGIDENADEAAVLAAIEGLKTPAEPSTPTIQEPAPVEPVAVPTAQNDPSAVVENPADVVAPQVQKLAASLAEVQASQAASEKLIASLSGELATRRLAEAATHKAQVFASALSEGRITPAQRAEWEKSYDESPAAIERVLASIAPNTHMTVSASGYAGTGETVTDDDMRLYESWFPKAGGSNG